MIEFIKSLMPYVTKTSFIFLIVMSVIFGVSIAMRKYIASVIKKVRKNSDANYKKLTDEEAKACNAAISAAKTDYGEFLKENKKQKKLENRNKIRKVFKLKQIEAPVRSVTVKEVMVSLAGGVAEPFLGYKGKKKRSFLSFSEREIFTVLKTLKIRLKEIIDSADIEYLKDVKISFVLECVGLVGKFGKIKNNGFYLLGFKIVNFFLWFTRFISPVGIGKYLVNDISGDNLQTLIADAFIDIVGQELAVIYKEKSFGEENVLRSAG